MPSSRYLAGLSLLALILAWAGIYLPALGSLELRGEEGRRALPALSMIETGDWLVPEVGGENYFRKPPLVNWAVAASIMLTGEATEWSVRLPSVLAVLALALGILHAARPWLGLPGALMAALFAITNISLIEKGRLIEIEAIYIALFGLAFVFWLRDWLGGRPTLGWVVAGVFLGLGMLAKGPPHLLFFYAMAAGVILGTREGGWRAVATELLRPSAWIALGITLAIFALWSVPMMQSLDAANHPASGGQAAATWWQQLSARLGFDGFNFWKWWENLFRSAIINFLPWSLFFPLVWHKPLVERMEPTRARLFTAMRGGLLVGWLVVAILPGSLPRYTLPLLVPASLLVAMALVEWSRFHEPAWLVRAWRWTLLPLLALAAVCGLAIPFYAGFSPLHILVGTGVAFTAAVGMTLALRLSQPLSLALVSSLLLLCSNAVFATAIVPRMVARDKLRPMAATVKAALPPDATLGFFRPEYQPILFYLPKPLLIPLSTDDLNSMPITHLLVRERHLDAIRRRRDWKNAPTLATLHDLDGKPLHLLQRMPPHQPR